MQLSGCPKQPKHWYDYVCLPGTALLVCKQSDPWVQVIAHEPMPELRCWLEVDVPTHMRLGGVIEMTSQLGRQPRLSLFTRKGVIHVT